MNDFLELQSSARDVGPAHVAAGFLADPPSASHTVQFYDDEGFLLETVARFAGAGLEAGDRVLLIVTPEHARGVLGQLDPECLGRALHEGQLSVVDARALLGSVLVDDLPDTGLFRAALAPLLEASLACPARRVRAFGEMVDVLWRAGNRRAALRLEELWVELLEEQPIALLCGYAAAHFRELGDSRGFSDVCASHTHVMPTERYSQLADSQQRLREISMLQQRARALEGEVRQRKAIESALREVLERRAQVEAELRASLEREQEARLQAQANDAFKEVFMGILGHDLRNPLNTILTTARLMILRGELLPESEKRVERVITSGVRMQRMIEQILDMARDRLTSGIAISRTAPRDLVALVAKIVEETRLAHPERRIELASEGSCLAAVDADRFEQVISNLLGNAATHGDPARPILVRVARVNGENGAAQVSLSVRNYGAPIDPDFLPLLFDPFRRQRKPEGRSAGLGLGLYISERIVRAHGGTIRVESSEQEGTLFETVVPCESSAAHVLSSLLDRAASEMAAAP
ncbi:MAG TPA: ATP-binding protein [Polyangiaceae bacterium]|nr:ATP-binding protein [Polyangiaceae bacterium]